MCRKLLLCVGCLLLTTTLYAEEIVFKNGDRLQGTIISDSSSEIVLKTESMGEVAIDRAFIAEPAYEEPMESPQEKPATWERTISAGYSQSGGNTVGSKANAAAMFNRKTEDDELTFKGSLLYASNDKKMDTQKWLASARYAVSFGEDKDWYRLIKVEVDHDRFSNIDKRVVPSAGVGYWFAKEEAFKLLAETALGYEKIWYRSGKGNDGEITVMPRVFFEKELFKSFRFVQDATAYLAVSDAEQYRIHSETSLVYDMSDSVSLRWSLIDDYNAVSSPGTKKNDYTWITAIDYRF